MYSKKTKPTSFRLTNRVIKNLRRIHVETGFSYNGILSEMIRSYFKKLEKRRKAQQENNK